MNPLSFLFSLFLLSEKKVSGLTPYPQLFNGMCQSVPRSASTRRFGISEWRDMPSGMYRGDENNVSIDVMKYGPSVRLVPVLRIASDEVVLPGERKYFQFQSDVELRLFQRALDRNHGIFALGAIIREDEHGDDVMMDKIQLMEIKQYNMNVGNDFGIFCTAQAVGRAKLFSVIDDKLGTSVDGCKVVKEPLIAICEEHFDIQESYYSMEDAHDMAKGVLEIISNLSNKEQEIGIGGISSDHDVKIIHAVDNEEEDDEDYSDNEETRKDRFAQAYLESFESDSQGYITNFSNSERIMSWKEMNAISWAAFATSENLSEDEAYRLYAFDQDRITDRLKLATYWLSDVFQETEQGSNLR